MACIGMRDIEQAKADLAKSAEAEPERIISLWVLEWIQMSQLEARPGIEMAERLELIAANSTPATKHVHIAHVCREVAQWVRGNFEEALLHLEQSLVVEYEQEDAHFWKGIVLVSLQREEEAKEAIEKALAISFPALLLVPLRWFKQDRPEFYEQYVVPLLRNNDL
jgi:tetratricopeptide (TPR) repeat protein